MTPIGFAALVACCSADLGLAQVDRWTNPAGGPFAQDSNWDANHPPATTDTAAFGPVASYTVTLAATTSVANMVVDQGTPTIDGAGNRLNIGPITTGNGDLTIAGTTAMPAMLTFRNGSLRIALFGNVYVGSGAGTAGTFVLESDATMPVERCYVGGDGTGLFVVRGTAADIGLPETDGAGEIYLQPGSTIRVEGGALTAHGFQHLGGHFEVHGGHLNFLIWNAVGAGTTLITDGASVQCGYPLINTGTMTISGGANVFASGGQFGGDMRVDGAGTVLTTGTIDGGLSTFTVANGATVSYGNDFHLTGTPEVVVGPGCAFGPGDFSIAGGHVRVDQGAAVSFSTFMLPAQAGLIETVDGAALPSTPMINCTGSNASSLAGTLEIRVAHPNNFHIGDQIEVLRSVTPYQGSFASLSAPIIGGGRVFQIQYTATSVFVRIVAGGDPCWTADFNGDGAVATDADIDAFFLCLAGMCCPTCASADFNGDGAVATDADIEAFFRVLAGQPC
jgi:hypothetical protein